MQPSTRASDEPSVETTAPAQRSAWKSLGPSLITAAVVIGPGTITVASKLGAGHGYAYLWVIASAAVFMWLFVTMAARVGILNEDSLMSVVARLYGRPLAVIVGLLAFTVATAFQLSNYLACATALTTLSGAHETVWIAIVGAGGLVFLLVRQLYRFAERVMSILVFSMIAAFFVNLLVAGPNWGGVIVGLVPGSWPKQSNPLILAMVGTTFSVIAAFYQGTLARQKGWKAGDLSVSRREAAIGIGLLATISCVIMITAGTVLRGVNISSAAVLGGQLEPVLGPLAVWLFSFGFLSAGFSSVVINPMVGGGILSDALGWGDRVDSKWPRILTAAGMLTGIVCAYLTLRAGSALDGIVKAQGMTVLAVPLCAIVLVMLANDKRAVGQHTNGWVANTVAVTAVAVLITMSAIRLMS